MNNTPANIKEVRITQRQIVELIERERVRAGDSTASKAVGRIVTEYRIMRELMMNKAHDREQFDAN